MAQRVIDVGIEIAFVEIDLGIGSTKCPSHF